MKLKRNSQRKIGKFLHFCVAWKNRDRDQVKVMANRLLLILGTGRCGLASQVYLLNRQLHTKATLEELPLLPWCSPEPGRLIRERLARLRRSRGEGVLADAASFYLPYVEEAIAAEPDVRIIGLRRPLEEVMASFGRFLDEWNVHPTNHWANEPAPGWFHDPLWTRCFPHYNLVRREEGLRRYCDDYQRQLDELAKRYPQNVRVFDMAAALNTEQGQRSLLDFAGFPVGEQVLAVGVRASRARPARPRRTSSDALEPRKCVVLVPFAGFIHPECESALVELERRGYEVRRVAGFAAIDQGRNQMATDALLDGFDETMWIDADVEFPPDGVEQLRAHGLPICCGVYPKKGQPPLRGPLHFI
jgi:hypothetical protein